MLAKLGNERILRSVAGNGAGSSRYEIFHDVLAEPVLAWKAGHEAHRELDRQRGKRRGGTGACSGPRRCRVVALLVMAGVTVFALTQRSEAQRQTRKARARALDATALLQMTVDPERSLGLAVEAANLDPDSQAEDVLRRALFASRERGIFHAGDKVTVPRFVPLDRDSTRILVAGLDGHASA